MTESSYLRMVAVLRGVLLGMGCLLSLFFAKTGLREQTFWTQQSVAMSQLYQQEKTKSAALDKLFSPAPYRSAEVNSIGEHIKTLNAQNLDQLQALSVGFHRDKTNNFLTFLLLQFGVLGAYLTFWYVLRNPQARLLATLIRYGHQRGTFIS